MLVNQQADKLEVYQSVHNKRSYQITTHPILPISHTWFDHFVFVRQHHAVTESESSSVPVPSEDVSIP